MHSLQKKICDPNSSDQGKPFISIVQAQQSHRPEEKLQ